MAGKLLGISKVRSYWVVYVGFDGTTNVHHYQFTTKRDAEAFARAYA